MCPVCGSTSYGRLDLHATLAHPESRPMPGNFITGPHKKGEVHKDSRGNKWVCTEDGDPGLWARAITGPAPLGTPRFNKRLGSRLTGARSPFPNKREIEQFTTDEPFRAYKRANMGYRRQLDGSDGVMFFPVSSRGDTDDYGVPTGYGVDYRAVCIDPFGSGKADHDKVPDPDCSCGNYAKTQPYLARHGQLGGSVGLEVDLYGRIVHGTDNVVRGEHQRVVKLWLHDECDGACGGYDDDHPYSSGDPYSSGSCPAEVEYVSVTVGMSVLSLCLNHADQVVKTFNPAVQPNRDRPHVFSAAELAGILGTQVGFGDMADETGPAAIERRRRYMEENPPNGPS